MTTDKNFIEMYRNFEDHFRGEQRIIRQRLEVYTPLIKSLTVELKNKPAVDLGAGRGEWLRILSENGFPNLIGVEPDETMANSYSDGTAKNVTIDALSFLNETPDESLGVLSAFHVIEHVEIDYLVQILQEAYRSLSDNGLLILETPNPENLAVASWTFYLDPTHKRPIPPDLLAFLVRNAGFKDLAIVRLNGASPDQSSFSLVDALFRTAPDYAVVAVKSNVPSRQAQSFAEVASERGIRPYIELIKQEQETHLRLQDDQELLYRLQERVQTELPKLQEQVSTIIGINNTKEDEHSAYRRRLINNMSSLEERLSQIEQELMRRNNYRLKDLTRSILTYTSNRALMACSRMIKTQPARVIISNLDRVPRLKSFLINFIQSWDRWNIQHSHGTSSSQKIMPNRNPIEINHDSIALNSPAEPNPPEDLTYIRPSALTYEKACKFISMYGELR